MAGTLHHEVLHVWFVNTRSDRRHPTGHGDVATEKNPYNPEFKARLDKFEEELAGLQLKMMEQEDRAPRGAAPTRSALDDVPDLDLPPRPKDKGRPGLGFELSGELLGGKGGGGRFAGGIVGGTVILDRLHSLRVGVRGVYLTPGSLLVGGTAGYRAVQGPNGITPGQKVTRPLFFDLEAGVLRELAEGDTAAFRSKFALYGSAAVGQQLGSRFFWRAGGFVVVSDQRDAGGNVQTAYGATLGGGVRF
jgi:hypothetical protein